MRNISDFINENINEGTMDNIILQNLAEISDNDIVDDVQAVMGDDLNSADILRIWDFLKKKFGKDLKKWEITPNRDYQKYILACNKWADAVVSKYNLGDNMKKIVSSIGYAVNSL